MKLINVGLMKQPVNWFIVLLMLMLAGVGGHFVLTYLGHEPATSE